MELDLGINVGNNKNNEIEEFTKELNNVLQEDKILVYQGYDSRKFTNVNEERIWDKREELITKSINENNINGADDNKLYEIRDDVAGGIGVLEYNKTYDNRTYLTVKETELPENVDKGMFFRKVDGNYILDKQTTEKIYNEMISFQNELILEQKELLNDMRQEGAIYKVTYLEDDCEDWRTELTKQETGETFQELEFPHDIYHQVGSNSLVKYENGTYTVVEGTSVYDLYPNIIENYCENEGVYITQNGKYETSDELYESLNMNNEEKLMRKVTNVIDKILKFAVDKLVELVKNKQ
ncbi:MAG: hypothetical protein IJE05_00120 [Clostridia bacterium]|nr:hypothetical protein [Clostridia bacterium]